MLQQEEDLKSLLFDKLFLKRHGIRGNRFNELFYYRKNYWDRMKCNDIPAGLDLCLFDFGVNAGTGRAAKYLQNMIGTVADGGIGPNTLRALANYVESEGLERTILNYQADRQDYYESLSTFKTFGKGWTRRVSEVTEKAKEWIS